MILWMNSQIDTFIMRGDNMTMNDIITIISTCGFPIFACVYLARTQAKELEKLGELIANNTKAINELKERVKK